MTKYSKTLKIKVVQDYLTSPLGYKLIARKYGIKSNSLVVSWVQRYKAFGPKRLDVLSPKKTFDGSFKMNVLKWMKTNKASYPKTALHFNISNVGTIWQWHIFGRLRVLMPYIVPKDGKQLCQLINNQKNGNKQS
ncbi:hypothetical protein A4W74_09265 [Latilactobacillus curvatus]|nr:hypothetical protein A4W74_09265 [Latilactobacillus curvatus]